MAPALFMGHSALGPEDNHPPDHVPTDSPRHHSNRSRPEEANADRLLAMRKPRLVRKPDGHVVELAAHQPMKPGWVVLDSNADAEVGRAAVDDQLDWSAHELHVSPYRTGRRVNMLGEGGSVAEHEVTDDRDMIGTRHGAGILERVRGKKP